jgi:2'-5' RNA ligase
MPEMSDGDRLRLFVAVELPEEIRDRLRQVATELRAALPAEPIRWVRPEGIHLTLKFLGDVEAARVEDLRVCLAGALPGVSPFELQPTTLGSFGGRGGLRVIWIGLAGDTEALAELAGAVERSLTPLGFSAERRPYRGHLTLARIRDRTDRATRIRIHELLSEQPQPRFSPFRVDRVSLMQSTLSPGGARYTSLASLPLD